MIELVKNDVSIDKLKLHGYDFSHDLNSRKLKLKFPHGLKFGDEIISNGFDNRGMVDDGLMIDIYNDDRIFIEFNPNNIPINNVNKILKKEWGIHTNIMSMDVKRIDLERSRVMDKDLIYYHDMLKYVAKARVQAWQKMDTFYYGGSESLKQFCLYTKESKDKLVRGELRLFRDLSKLYDINDLKNLHGIDTLNDIYIKEFDSYMGKKLDSMLNNNKILESYDDTNKILEYEQLFDYCVTNEGKSLDSFIKKVGFYSMSVDGWMQFANSRILTKLQRYRFKQLLNKMMIDSDKFTNRFKLDKVQKDIFNLLKFRNVA